MAIYKAKTGEWFNSDETTSGPGVQIDTPSWAGGGSSGGDGGDGEPQRQAQAVTAPQPVAPAEPYQPQTMEDWANMAGSGLGATPRAPAPGGTVVYGRTTPVTPTVTAPSPPTVTQVAPTVYGKTTPVQPIVTAPAPPTVTQGQGVETPSQRPNAGQAAQPQPGKRTVVGSDGQPFQVDAVDYDRVTAYLREINDLQQKQQMFENDLKRREGDRADAQLKVSQMLAEAERVYREALIAGQGADRAQRAAEAAMQNNYQMQMLSLQQQLQGQRVALEQRSAQQQRRERRPFAPRPRVSYA